MSKQTDKPNRLIDESSPYLISHAYNPVDWHPWGNEAFARAKAEDKPIFLSIGYSTCHWCHVMARESFEDADVAAILNESFVCVKVDKEERPDVDSVYMRVCQSMTGGGGWPLSVFMAADGLPFFTGTYFPKTARYGHMGFTELLATIKDLWLNDRKRLMASSFEIMEFARGMEETGAVSGDYGRLLTKCVTNLKSHFDPEYGGFGVAPKFPAAHNVVFLLEYYKRHGDEACLSMAEKTLSAMYRGGIYDHIGGGFSRYSTDRHWLAPHFEKMLYDNALLLLAYAKAYALTGNGLYRRAAIGITDYVSRELTGEGGGFLCAQDADSDGVEGRYYVFTPREVLDVLGEEAGARFCAAYDITERGNFEGKNIPNLIKSESLTPDIGEGDMAALLDYRAKRAKLLTDDKSLCAWSGLMIAALAAAYAAFGGEPLIKAAKSAAAFIEKNLADDTKLYASYRMGRRGAAGFLDDYAFYIMALICLYEATFDAAYLDRAISLCEVAVSEFLHLDGGFYQTGRSGERLPLAIKETYDGAMPSGNSVMTWNLTMLSYLSDDADNERRLRLADEQTAFMARSAANTPEGSCFFMLALLLRERPPKKIVCVLAGEDEFTKISALLPKDAINRIYIHATKTYPLLNGKTTFYICEDNICYPPTNEPPAL